MAEDLAAACCQLYFVLPFPFLPIAGGEGELDDLQVAEDLVATCCQLYARMPAGLAPEIAFFRATPGAFDSPKAHPPDAGGADLYVKAQVRRLVIGLN